MSPLFRALLGVLLLSSLPTLLAASFAFNPEYIDDCLESNGVACSFSNASLWVDTSSPNTTNATLPGPNDTVDIYSPVPILLTIDYAAQLTSLTVLNASLLVAMNSSLYLTSSFSLGNGSRLTVDANASVSSPTANATFTLAKAAFLVVNSGGSFAWYGKGSFFGTFEVAKNSDFFMNQINQFSPFDMTLSSTLTIGYLWVTGTCIFSGGLEVFSLIAAPNVWVIIGNTFTGSLSLDAGAEVTFSRGTNFTLVPETDVPPITGSGTLSINDATGVINSTTPSTFNGTISLTGFSYVTLVGLTLPNLISDDNATIYANGVVLSGNNVSLPGLVIAQQNGLTISGSPVYASVVVVSSLTVSGVFFPDELQWNNGSRINLAGGLIHSSVVIPAQSTLAVTSPSQIVGSILNEGSVNVTTTNTLEIWSGDYTQNGGTFSVVLDKTGQAALNVINGSISLNSGGIQFSIKDKPFLKSAKFLVAQANATINGTFAGDASPLQGSEITRSLAVKYQENPNTIYIQYSFNPKDVVYWMWIVLGVGVALVIVAIVAVALKCRKRRKYEPVRA